eukprot:PITA_15849
MARPAPSIIPGMKLVLFTNILILWANTAAASQGFRGYIRDVGLTFEYIASEMKGAPYYDASAFTQCLPYPAAPLYGGGIFRNLGSDNGTDGWNGIGGLSIALHTESQDDGSKYLVASNRKEIFHSPLQTLENLRQDVKYSLSAWVQVRSGSSALVKATVGMDDVSFICAGTVHATSGCWSFLKGGFVPDWSPAHSRLYFESNNTDVQILVDSVSLQPFTEDEWRLQQEERIAMKRKKKVIVHVTDLHGNRLQNAEVIVKQKSRQFPFGSAIAKTILGNEPYQKWFAKRFNTAVFENELKWYTTEPEQGKLNYSLADEMLAFCNANSISARGHNIFWEDPKYNPSWVMSLDKEQLQKAVCRRIESLVKRYTGNFINWDVSNELLHFSFYEDKLGPNASDSFFKAAQGIDPWTPMFMNDYNIIETCDDSMATVDSYIKKLQELRNSGRVIEGIGLESHFSKPNLPLMRAVLDKFRTLGLPIWLTEVDVSSKFDEETQARYLEEILREGFSHPAVEGMLMWCALDSEGCHEMCLTDKAFNNLPAGDAVDRLLDDWRTGVRGKTDAMGCFKFEGFLGDYEFVARYATKNVTKTSTLRQLDHHGSEHVYIQI